MTRDLKAEVHDFWQAHPCGTRFAGARVGSREFFEEVERHRYSTEWHIPEVVRFERWRDRDVLEIGCGLGTDGINFARAGARYLGIDLTEASIDLVARRFDYENLDAALQVADAENLPFQDSSFDLVYSHGVLHHTPDTQRAIDELHRVLRPGGTAMVMLYHKNSYNYLINIMTLRRIGVRLLGLKNGVGLVRLLTGEDRARLEELQRLYRESPAKLLSRPEFLNQNTDGVGNPLAKVYTREQAAKMFARFRNVQTEVHFMNRRWIPLVGRLIGRSLEKRISSRW